jgi:hypothetical protein
MSKKTKGIVIALISSIVILIGYQAYSINMLSKKSIEAKDRMAEQEQTIKELNTPSQIEQDEMDLKQALNNADFYRDEEIAY